MLLSKDALCVLFLLKNIVDYICSMRFLLITFMLFASSFSFGQKEEKAHIYDPAANAEEDIKAAVAKAAVEHKHVFIQVGGNWCVWCRRFHALVEADTTLTRVINSNYVIVHVNYSPENKNEKVLAQLDYPQRFGYPVFVILDAKGNRIHTQNSGYLEEGLGHSKKKVEEFLKQWSPVAVDPNTYKK